MAECPTPKGTHIRTRRKERLAKRDAKRSAKAQLAQTDTPVAEPIAQLAALLGKEEGVEVWLTMTIAPAASNKRTINSGATHCMCGDISLFFNFRHCAPSPVGGVSGNKNGLVVTGVDSLLLKLASGRVVVIHQALLAPGIAANLLSTSQLYDNHGVTTFGKEVTLLRDGVVLATGSRLRQHLYQLDGELIAPTSTKGAAALLASGTAPRPKLTTWHCRFAHLSLRSLKSLARSDHVKGLKVASQESKDPCPCNTCHVSHASRLPFPHSERQAVALLELVHSDVLQINVPSLGGRRYVVTFFDDYSRMLWVEPLAHKSDVFGAFQRFKAAAENESGRHVLRFARTTAASTCCTSSATTSPSSIRHETPPPYSPQSNGVADA